jgi:hypothetical protein
MPSNIPDLWTDDITVDIVTPLAILRAQSQGLERRTKGLLEAEINSQEKENEIVHWLDLVAPALGFRERILTATHVRNRVYPVTLEARCFAKNPKQFTVEETRRAAVSQQEFIELLAQVLRSGDVRSSIQSLLARSNDENTTSTKPSNGAGIAPMVGANDKSGSS